MKTEQTLEYWPLDRFIDYARNPRKNDHAVDKVASAIREFGFRVPVVAKSDGTVVDGHLRLKAAKKLGLDTVPVLLADDLSETQIKAFRISVNKMAELADWDDELLRGEMLELMDEGFDATMLGFGDMELASIMLEKQEGETDPEAEWKGMPEYDQPDATSFRKVIVHFACQSDCDEFFRLLGQTSTDKTKSIWHPEQQNMDTESRRYG